MKTTSDIKTGTFTKVLIGLFFIALFFIQYPRLIFVKGILYSHDIRLVIYPWRVAAFQSMAQHQSAKWTDYMYCGYPLGADFVTAMFYPINYFFFRFFPSPESGFNYYILFHLTISVIGMFLYCHRLGLSHWASVLSTLSYSFGGYMVTRLCQPTVFDMFCWLPWIVLCLELSFQKKKWGYSVLAGLIQGLVILGGHPNISLYIFCFSCIYILFLGMKKDKSESSSGWKFTAIQLFFFLFLSLGIGALLAFPARELILESYRAQKFSFERMTEGSVTWSNLIQTIFPFIFGGPKDYQQTDTSFVEAMFYFGSFPLLFFLLSLLMKKNRYQRFYLWVSLIALIIAMGKYTPFYLLLSHIPVIQHMHAPGRAALFLSFGIPVIAGFVLDQLRSNLLDRLNRIPWKEVYMVFIFVFIVGLFLIFHSIQGNGISERLSTLTSQIYLSDTFIHLILIFIAISLLYFWIRKQILYSTLCLWVVVVTTIELLMMGNILNQSITKAEDIALVRNIPDTAQFLNKDKSEYRIYSYSNEDSDSREDMLDSINILYRSISMLYGIRGFHCHTTTSFVRFFDLLGLPEELWIHATPEQRIQELYKRIPILSMMNVKYIVTKEKLDSPLLTLVFTGSANVYQLNSTFPRAFFVNHWQVAQNKEQALQYMQSSQTDFQTTVILEEPTIEISMDSSKNANAHISYDEISPIHVKIQCQSDSPGLVLLSDAYYPGWKAILDGKPVKIYRANYLIRAIPIHEGSHQIEYYYNSLSYKLGLWIFIFTIIIVLAILGVCIVRKGLNSIF